MKLYAQHGAQNGTKLDEGIQGKSIDGVVFSPRDISAEKLQELLTQIRSKSKTFDLFFDPQLYACFLAKISEARLGYLLDDYSQYFRDYRRSHLEREKEVSLAIKAAVEFEQNLPLTAIIAPNILIPASFNSIEAVIAKNFIRLTASEYAKLKDKRPIYATLAVSREALLDKQELMEFLNEITALDKAPDGFYVVIAARNTEARSDIYHADVIAGMMLINYSLNVNGFKVINGYSDILTPFLGAAGAEAGCTGWWSNLRTFSLDRFAPSQGGGKLPIYRYLSMTLLNRITFYELDQLRNLISEIVNNLSSDSFYPTDSGSEPENRTTEMLQSWDAIKALNNKIVSKTVALSLRNCLTAIKIASETYDKITIQLDRKSLSDHIDALSEGIRAFIDRAEIKLPNE
ncbi:MAG: hypothetical protein ABSE89_11430 [Sedimentisphaerales bacterium]